MSDNQKPQGQRFSHVYLDRGKPEEDSVTMRRRLAALIYSIYDLRGLGSEVPGELGVDVPTLGNAYDWRRFFKECQLVSALDVITVAYGYLSKRRRENELFNIDAHKVLVTGVDRIFREENVAYSIDPEGGVHHLVDAEFRANRQSTIAALTASRYTNVRDCAERARVAFSEIPPDGKGAIRSTFAAAEGLFKLMFPRQLKLDSDAVKRLLPPVVQRIYNGDSPALTTASKMVASLADWVDAAHPYRHEQGSEEVAQPPFELAVNLVSLGNSFIRWLAELDQKANAS